MASRTNGCLVDSPATCATHRNRGEVTDRFVSGWHPGLFVYSASYCPPYTDSKFEIFVQILLTNDDGIYAPGIAALEKALGEIGQVCLVSPAVEQSGVGHSITFLTPLTAKPVYEGDHLRGHAVDGTPADCVKLGIFEFCPEPPDLIVSGINGGLNAGINVLYSGTVAAAIEGAFFGITSIAVSLEYNDRARYDAAARIAVNLIRQILEQKSDAPQLYNINIPTIATHQEAQVKVVPMGLQRYGQDFIKRQDPKGRVYYWASGEPPPAETAHETDVSALKNGNITVTPLGYDMTCPQALEAMKSWRLNNELHHP